MKFFKLCDTVINEQLVAADVGAISPARLTPVTIMATPLRSILPNSLAFQKLSLSGKTDHSPASP
jgi:hypothetical protein